MTRSPPGVKRVIAARKRKPVTPSASFHPRLIISVYASYAYVNAEIREKGDTYGNEVPFSPKHKGTFGVDYKPGSWTFNLNGDFQSSQFADNANTVAESADGSTGRIPGYMLWGARVAYDFGPQMANLNLALG